MNELSNVSYQAFLEEVQNWELTLTRQAKKLKQLKKSVSNKLQINTIDITLLAIESQFIQYRKIKDKKFSDNASIVELYNSLSKKFINLIEKIGDATDQQKYQNNSHNISKNEETLTDHKAKHFLQETFTYNMSKQPMKKKTYSVMETKRQLGQLAREKSKSNYRKASKSILDDKKFKNLQNVGRLQLQEEQDLSDIRYQLKEIKSMIVQMDKQIKLHNHEEIDRQLSKLAHNNKKIQIEIKTIREDNQFLLARMQNIKDQINHEKQLQNNMIKQFQAGKQNSGVVNQISKQDNLTEEVSEWVKVRI